MEKISESQRKFILDTLLPYKKDRKTCAMQDNLCVYLTEDGRKCALGQHMKPGPWQKSESGVYGVFEKYGSEEVLTKKAFDQKLENIVWNKIQAYHDNLSSEHLMKGLRRIVDDLEIHTGVKFPELR